MAYTHHIWFFFISFLNLLVTVSMKRLTLPNKSPGTIPVCSLPSTSRGGLEFWTKDLISKLASLLFMTGGCFNKFHPSRNCWLVWTPASSAKLQGLDEISWNRPPLTWRRGSMSTILNHPFKLLPFRAGQTILKWLSLKVCTFDLSLFLQ